MHLALIALGGAAGALLRYGVSEWVTAPRGGFPLATLLANTSGAFLLGAASLLLVRLEVSTALRLGLTIGVLGAYLTLQTTTSDQAPHGRHQHQLLDGGSGGDTSSEHAAEPLEDAVGAISDHAHLAFAGDGSARRDRGVPIVFVTGREFAKPGEGAQSGGHRFVVGDLGLVRPTRAEHGQEDAAAPAGAAAAGLAAQAGARLTGHRREPGVDGESRAVREARAVPDLSEDPRPCPQADSRKHPEDASAVTVSTGRTRRGDRDGQPGAQNALEGGETPVSASRRRFESRVASAARSAS